MKRILSIVLFLGFFLIVQTVKAQDTIVSWTFLGTSADSLVDSGIPVNIGAYFHGWYGTPGTSSFSYLLVDFTTNGTLGAPDKAARAVAWTGGKDSAYWIVSFKTTGYSQLTLSSKQQSGGAKPGPRDFLVQYKLASDNVWKNIDTLVLANDWVSGNVSNLNLPAECNNQSNEISIRWLMSSDVSNVGGSILPTGISKIDDIVVTGVANVGYTISGLVTYNNSSLTPLTSVTVTLLQNSVVLATTTTDNQGTYIFNNVTDGTYSVDITTSRPWDGVTATDALKVKRHIAGLELLTESVRISAADVNNTFTVNATDVLKIQRRLVGLDTSFARPDWIFEPALTGGNTVAVSDANVIQNFYGLCSGDVNGSFTPVY